MNRSEKQAGHDGVLLRAVRAAMASDAVTPPEIPEEVIVAYLSGNATSDERVKVQEALVTSDPFRRNLLEIGHDLQRLERATRRIPRLSRPRLHHLGFAFGAAAALVAALILAHPGRLGTRSPGSSVRLVTEPWRPAPGWFTPRTVRSLSQEEEIVEPTPRQAALAAFRSCVVASGDRLRTIELSPGARPGRMTRRTVIRLEAAADRRRAAASIAIPVAAKELRVWVLALPSLEVRSAPIEGDSVLFIWDSTALDSAAVTVTCRAPGGHSATPGRILRFR
jgi:hypothetical protein